MATVRIAQRGVLHLENGQLILGDLLVDKAFAAKWGGNRQYGLLEMQFTIEDTQSSETSPDLNGTFAERSEPH